VFTHTEISVGQPRKHWTRSELKAISKAGLPNIEKWELIQGDLIGKVGKTRPHSIGLWLLLKYLLEVFSIDFIQQEVPIDVRPQDNPTSEPEPDIIVLTALVTTFTTNNPRPSDIRLVCEVSDSLLAFDLTTKAHLCARAGILEYWVLDIVGTRLIAHRTPSPEGYQSIQAYAPTETLAPLSAPASSVTVSQFFNA